jgi:magnesium transporter
MLGREVVTGLLIGLTLALAFLVPGALLIGEGDVALTVAVTILATSSMATLIATTLPLLFAHRGVDPAFGSGPLATVTQDLVSIAIYLALARAIVS